MAIQSIPVPDIGGAENVDVIEICVAVGDEISADDALVVLESDKASMDIPSPVAGKVVGITIKEGDKVSEGDAIIELEVGADSSEEPASDSAKGSAPAEPAPAESQNADASGELAVSVPDIGGAEGVDVIEVCVAVGDEVSGR